MRMFQTKREASFGILGEKKWARGCLVKAWQGWDSPNFTFSMWCSGKVHLFSQFCVLLSSLWVMQCNEMCPFYPEAPFLSLTLTWKWNMDQQRSTGHRECPTRRLLTYFNFSHPCSVLALLNIMTYSAFILKVEQEKCDASYWWKWAKYLVDISNMDVDFINTALSPLSEQPQLAPHHSFLLIDVVRIHVWNTLLQLHHKSDSIQLTAVKHSSNLHFAAFKLKVLDAALLKGVWRFTGQRLKCAHQVISALTCCLDTVIKSKLRGNAGNFYVHHSH